MTAPEMLSHITKWERDTKAIATGLYNLVNHLPTSEEWNIDFAGDETLRINNVLVMYCPKNEEYQLLNDAPKYGLVYFTDEAYKMGFFLLGYLKGLENASSL